MAYTLSWVVPERVIGVVISHDVGDNTQNAFDADIKAMLDTASQPVHILLDVRQMKSQPSAQTSLGMSYLKHPQMGRLLVVGLSGNPFLRFLSALVGRMSGVKIRDFPTHEDALLYLKSVENV